MRVLLVEDDAMLLDGLRLGLKMHGFQVEAVSLMGDAEAATRASRFDAMVLDIMLPDGSGLDLLRQLRARGDATPVLLLTARDAVGDRVQGLDDGADDYLGKPFDLDEVAARLRALGRRAQGRPTPQLIWGALVLDPARRDVALQGNPVALSRREFAVLEALMERPGFILSREDLQERLYGWQDDVESNAIEVHIHKLRHKLGRDAIRTLRGVGYRMGEPVA
ncbi:response regulator [Roseomonas aerophila]|uniref:Response regulator n=1 Tax=Teichococcus aerophilus TaxID=1224513 RepID=A0ABR7RP38_9PROT|nr:response regulator [Pseudoroseomonas aerophila]MBC9208108.1 response regulator [Pseudoroseomonas aerophila]